MTDTTFDTMTATQFCEWAGAQYRSITRSLESMYREIAAAAMPAAADGRPFQVITGGLVQMTILETQKELWRIARWPEGTGAQKAIERALEIMGERVSADSIQQAIKERAARAAADWMHHSGVLYVEGVEPEFIRHALASKL